MSDAKWQNNAVQFPRLLAEIMATQNLDLAVLAESMDLSIDEVNELFDRADATWEKAKQDGDVTITVDLNIFDEGTGMGAKERTDAALRETIEAFQAIEALLPAAKTASKLRACGLRLVGDPQTIVVLQAMAGEGNADARQVVGNLFPRGHAEVS